MAKKKPKSGARRASRRKASAKPPAGRAAWKVEIRTPPVPADVAKRGVSSIAALRRRAAAGDAQAAYELGRALLLGKRVKRDPNMARVWLAEAARRGNASARALLDVRQAGRGAAIHVHPHKAVPDLHARVAAVADKIEAELRRMGWWRGVEPDPKAFESKRAFFSDTMPYATWVQAVLLPRIREIVAERGEFPRQSMVGVQAVRAFDGVYEADELTSLLGELDAVVEER